MDPLAIGSTDCELLKPEDMFMGVAVLASRRSKDPITKVGACLVSADNKIIGIGYNGHIKVKKGLNNDELFPWTKNVENYEQNKHMFVCHAETNAIFHSTGPVKGSTMFVTLNPCNDCARNIIQSEVKKVIYRDTRSFSNNTLEVAMMLFNQSEVEIIKFSDYMGADYEPKKICLDLAENASLS